MAWDESMRRGTKQVRIRDETHRILAEMARLENRQMIDEMDVLVRRGVAATDVEALEREMSAAQRAGSVGR